MVALIDRFWAKVVCIPFHECWEWDACTTRNGYGRFQIGYKTYMAHRVSYELHYGPIPTGLEIRHKCDNSYCVNPSHLELGTRIDNERDKVNRGRHAYAKRTHCINNHEFTPDNTKWRENRGRVCKECRKEAEQRRRDRLKEESHYGGSH